MNRHEGVNMIEMNASDGIVGNPGERRAMSGGAPPPPTPGDPMQKPSEIPKDPNEVQNPPPREMPPAPAPNEDDRERATSRG
jgi:hypothetical protein